MAAILDVAFLNQFSSIFVVLFVMVTVYAVLMFKGIFGGNKGIAALAAFSIGFIFLLAPNVVEIFKLAVPWFLLGLFFIVFVIILLGSLGIDSGVWGIMASNKQQNVVTIIIIYFVFVILFSAGHVMGQDVGPYLENGGNVDDNSISRATSLARGDGSVSSGSFQENLGATIFHPKILGVILIIVVSVFSAWWIGKTSI